MKYRPDFPGIAMVDTCLGLVLVFGVLLRLSVVMMNVETIRETESHTKSNALYLVKVIWPGDSNDDVDLYVGTLQHLVSFTRLSDGLMILTHDDTGAQSNKITLPDGREVASAFNAETVEIRGIEEGEYTVNLHMYNKREQNPAQCEVSLYKVEPNQDIKVHSTTLTLFNKGDEQTAFRFTLLNSGEIVDINQLSKRFVGVK